MIDGYVNNTVDTLRLVDIVHYVRRHGKYDITILLLMVYDNQDDDRQLALVHGIESNG